MKLSFAVFLLSLLVATTIAADVCLESVNPVGAGSACSTTTSCGYGLFCAVGKGRDGKCQKILKAGESCKSNNECDVNFSCIGPNDNKICVKNANPGEACSSSSDSTVARCSTGCDPVTNRCINGNVGDICTATSDCLKPLICGVADGSKDSTCLPVADGVNCTASQQCKHTSYCTPMDRICTPKKTSVNCTSSYECAFGFTCSRKTAEDRRQCVGVESFLDGSYCEASDVCQSKRCSSRGFCATKEATVCRSGSDCTYDQTCRCSGSLLSDGYGTCVTNPCVKAFNSFQECVSEKCHSINEADFSYDNSCAFKNCGSKYIASRKCSSASGVILSAMTIVFALFAVAFVF